MSSKVESADRPSNANNTVNTATATKATSQPASKNSKKPVAKKPSASASAVKSVSAKPAAKAVVKPAPVAGKATSAKPASAKPAALKPAAEKPKTEKVKMERDSFTIPKEEYAQIATLKKRMESLGKPVKKSELLRAGLKLLAAMNDAALQASLAAVPVIKTGRPKKKH